MNSSKNRMALNLKMSEGSCKRLKIEPIKCSLLNLHLHVPWKDVRRMIYRHWSRLDVTLVWIAHGCNSHLNYVHPLDLIKLGYLDILKWLKRKRNWVIDDKTVYCMYAAQIGQLEIIKWLRSNNCPWDKNTFIAAVIHGHLEVVQWLLANDCPFDFGITFDAICSKQYHVVNWLKERGIW
jgi:hypothetical protein